MVEPLLKLNQKALNTASAAIFGAAAFLLAVLVPAKAKPLLPVALTEQQLTEAITLSTGYLLAQTRPDGSFVYRININPQVRFGKKYNWLRHAGTLFSLADAYSVTQRPDVLAKIEKGVSHLRRVSLGPVTEFPGAYALWSDRKITGQNGPLTAKLGGAGLGLVAMTSLQRAKPGSVPDADLQGLGRFILAMQRPDGSFYSKYTPSIGGRDRNWVSLFYPGEAALGLTMLYEMDRNPKWLEGARKTLLFLSNSRVGQSKVPVDHWALIATQRLWPFLDEADRATFKRHARQIIDEILKGQVWEKSLLHGGFNRRGLTTGSATRLEGLLASEFIFTDDPDFHAQLRLSISWGIRFLMRAQITSGAYRGAIPRSVARMAGQGKKARSFNMRASEVRIDYVQHALSAFVGYLKLLKR